MQHFGSTIEVEMDNYPPTPGNAFLSRIVTVLQMGVIALALASEPICTALNIQLPENIVRELKEKKMMILMGAWFVGNTINNALTSTGAFEVYYEDALVFSKLETGRMPSSMDEIVQGIMRQTNQD